MAEGAVVMWGDEDSPALVTAVESALSVTIRRGGNKPAIKKVAEGRSLVEQGDRDDQTFVLLDGVITVEVDGEPLAALGPGAVLGERAVLEDGVRTSTLRAATTRKVASVPGDRLGPGEATCLPGAAPNLSQRFPSLP